MLKKWNCDQTGRRALNDISPVCATPCKTNAFLVHSQPYNTHIHTHTHETSINWGKVIVFVLVQRKKWPYRFDRERKNSNRSHTWSTKARWKRYRNLVGHKFYFNIFIIRRRRRLLHRPTSLSDSLSNMISDSLFCGIIFWTHCECQTKTKKISSKLSAWDRKRETDKNIYVHKTIKCQENIG